MSSPSRDTGGWLRLALSILTFPGIVLHEYAHAEVCRQLGTPVYEICYLRIGNPPGYVTYETPHRYRDRVLIQIAPFLVNTATAFTIFTLVSARYHIDQVLLVRPLFTEYPVVAAILLWVGVSAALHAFPSLQDAHNAYIATKETFPRTPSAILGYPIVGLLYLFTRSRRYGGDLVFTAAVIATGWVYPTYLLSM